MFIEHCDKIDIARILIERIDGVVAQARVSSIALANAVLERWASDTPESNEGQCQIQIIFEDGFQYRSHFGLKRSKKRISLAKHLRQQLLIATAPKKNSARKKDESVAPGMIAPVSSLSAEAILAQYDI